MKKYLKYVIFAVTMFLALHNTFGQRATSIAQIIQTPNSIPFNMVFSSEIEITTYQISNSTTGRYSVNRYSTDGQPLGSVIPWSDEVLSAMRIHDVESRRVGSQSCSHVIKTDFPIGLTVQLHIMDSHGA